MIEKLDFLVRLWELRARYASAGDPLGQAEQQELLSYLQLVTSDLEVPAAAPAPRNSRALPAQLLGEGATHVIELRDVRAGSLLATCATLIPAGTQVIVRVANAIGGVEYTLPCRVAWVHLGSPVSLALVVDGVPRQLSLAPQTPEAAMAIGTSPGRSLRWPSMHRVEVKLVACNTPPSNSALLSV